MAKNSLFRKQDSLFRTGQGIAPQRIGIAAQMSAKALRKAPKGSEISKDSLLFSLLPGNWRAGTARSAFRPAP